jgi:hypothetical protein
MVVALETHLRGCASCADTVAALRRTWAALDALPMVEPPPDFARRVAARVAEEASARRPSRPDFRALWQDWVRSLTPAHGLGAAAIAVLLVVGIALPLSQTAPGTRWGFLSRPPEVTSPAPPPSGLLPKEVPPIAADPTLAPRLTAQAPRWENGRRVGVILLTPARDLPGSAVRATGMTLVDRHLAGAESVDLARGTMRAARPYALPIPLETSRLGSHVLMLGVASPALAEEYRKVVAFPVEGGAGRGAIMLEFQGEEIYVALARLAGAIGRPIVADAGLTGKVSQRLVAAGPEQAMSAVLAPLGYRWQAAGDCYLVTRY